MDDILSLIAKANGVPGGMEQGVLVSGTGTSIAPLDLSQEHDGEGEPSSPLQAALASLIGTEYKSTSTSPQTCVANLVGCCGKGTSSKLAKRAKIDRNLMDALDKLADFSAEIEKLRIEASLTMHKDNLVDCQENKKLELELFQLHQASSKRMATSFCKCGEKNAE